MSAKTYFYAVRRSLFARGILGLPAERLVEELEDHFLNKLDDACRAGHDEAAAMQLALEALGTPESLAGSAAENLKAASWMARHPWLFSLGLGFSALAANQFFLAALIAIAGLHLDPGPWVQVEAQALAVVMNWTMLIAGGVCLYGLARHYAMGWRALFLSALSVTMFTSLVGVWTVAVFGPGDLRLALECSPLGALLVNADGGTYNLHQFVSLASPTSRMFLLHLTAPMLAFAVLRLGMARVMTARA